MPGDDEYEEPRAPRRMTFLGAAMWSFALGLVSALLRQMTDSARPGAGADLVNITACMVLSFSVFLFLIVRFYTPRGSIRDVLGIRPVSLLAGLLALATGLLLAPGLTIVDDVMAQRFPLSSEETEFLAKILDVSSRGQRIVFFASGALVIPLCDELFFRGVIFRGLRRGRAEGIAVIGTALLYALSRGTDLRSLPSGLVLGLLASWLRGRSGSIVPAILANVGLMSATFFPILQGKNDVDVGARIAIGGVIAAALCAWGAALVFMRSERAEEGRLMDA